MTGPGTSASSGDLFESAPCGYLLTDDDGTITRVNATFLAWTGHRREDLVGLGIGALLPVGDRILWSTHAAPALGVHGLVEELAVDVLGPGGERHPALLTARRTPAGMDGPACVRVILFSARERRRYEEDLLAARRRAEQSEARRAEAEAGLQRLVQQDPLTGLLNRAGLAASLVELLQARPADGRPRLALLFLDLDHFKAVNDSLGHDAGDELLTVVAERLRRVLRGSSTVARFAGDEFVVVDEVTGEDEAAALAARLVEAVEVPLEVGGVEVQVSASVGIALTDRTDGDAGRLLRSADTAMYRAKARGRGCVELHDPTAVDPSTSRLLLLGQLRSGVARGQLRVHYQPRVDLRTGCLDGAEALVRWEHPDRGLLEPAEFIEAAEQSGLVRELGAWVLDAAVRHAARWGRDSGTGAPLAVAVNLSARQLADPRLVGQVAGTLRRHGLDPALLTLELTETGLMRDPAAALTMLQELKLLGLSLAVDDFGTGWSSLTYLQRFPVDELKVDRSFVAGLPSRPESRAIVASCVQLAHAVGIRAVAEGVEHDAQRTCLLDLGCDLAQGHLFSRPVPYEQLVRWQRTRAPGRAAGRA